MSEDGGGGGGGLLRALAIHRGVPSVYRGGTAFYHRSVLERTNVFEFVARERRR